MSTSTTEEVEALRRRIEGAFPTTAALPEISLRGGNALDDYELPPPFDPDLDAVTDEYIEHFHFGIHFLDPASWRYYLPILLRYGLEQMESTTSSALDTFLFSLLPPDRDPPRFATLTAAQRDVVESFLELVGFAPASQYQDAALMALEQYWERS